MIKEKHLMEKTFSITVSADRELHKVSDTLFGIFMEDINWTLDGGINANMVNNPSFDARFIQKMNNPVLKFFIVKFKESEVIDRLRYWQLTGGKLESLHEDPAAENSWYARVHVDGQCRLENLGYNGAKRRRNACAISIREGQEYEFSCYARIRNYRGDTSISVENENGEPLTGTVKLGPTSSWKQWTLSLPGTHTGYGKLVIQFDGHGEVDLDGVSLMTTDTWGRGDPRWSQGKLRRDMVETIRDLKPRFLRFPGGTLVTGTGPGNEYNWKETLGPVINRKGKYNLWGMFLKDGGYFQSYHVGFYEYFLLCDDLGMEPVPIVFAGVNAQMSKINKIVTNSVEFREKVVQDVLDLIEYANGDPNTNPWAKLRAEAGHPEPFGLKYIGIGNENFGVDYYEKFEVIKTAIDARYPGITCILATMMPNQQKIARALAIEKFPDVFVDEHYAYFPGWYQKNYRKHDVYPRSAAPKVFIGEYAGNAPYIGLKPNIWKTAIADVVFMLSLERNSDVVAMASYAPLFSLCEGEQWFHNLINFNPAHVLLTSNYFVQKMFYTNMGTEVVDMQGELPKGIFASATTTKDRVFVKLVNTNSYEVHARVNLPGIPDGKAQVEYMHSDDPMVANEMKFYGSAEYRIEPKSMEKDMQDSALVLDLKPNGFYVLVINR
jgi:alpha-N-arabinofuranosidase